MNINIKSIEQLNDLTLYKEEDNLSLILEFPFYEKNHIQPIINKVKALKSDKIKLIVIIQAEQKNFSDEELKVFLSLEKLLKENEIPLYFDGGYKETYTLEEVIKADKKLDEIIDKINKSDLSPLEKYLYIYNYLTKKKYKYDPHEKDENYIDEYSYLPRDIISVINTDYIVCAGYSELNKYLCTNVGIKCFINYLTVFGQDHMESHMNNLIYLKDDKYHINGLFYSDACWDNNDQKRTYSFSLIPILDAHKLKNITIRFLNSNILFSNYIPSIFAYVEGRQGYDLIYFDYLNDKPSYFFDDLAKDLHIEPALEDIVDKSFWVIKNRLDRVNDLISLFKEKEISDDIYSVLSSSSCSTSISFFLASYMLGNNKKIIERGIDCLIKEKIIADENGGFAPSNPSMDVFDKTYNFGIQNVYETLDDIKNFDINELGSSFLELFDKVYKIKQARSETEYDSEHYKDYLHHDLILEIIYQTTLEVQRMLIHHYFQSTIYKKYNPFVFLDSHSLKEALRNVYMFEGSSLEEANNKVNIAIKESDHINKLAFSHQAYSYCWLEE